MKWNKGAKRKTKTETKDWTEIEKLQKTKNWNKETVEAEKRRERGKCDRLR